MSLTYRLLLLNLVTPSDQPVASGTATIVPSQQLTDVTDAVTVGLPLVVNFAQSSHAMLVTTDNENITPSGWYYNITFNNLPAGTVVKNGSFLFPYGGGTPLDYSAVTSVEPAPSVGIWLPLPSGMPTENYVVKATGIGQASEWAPESGGGAVSTVFGRTGDVVAASGDYSVADVTGAAPLADPALTGNPTAPIQSALDNSTKVATTAYADTAVGVETSRAEAAEALLAPLASPALTGTPTAPTPESPDNSNKIATTAYVIGEAYAYSATAQANAESFATSAVATETSRAEAAEGTNATAISTETSRAEAAEALLAPKANPTFTGSPAAPTQAAHDNSTKLATTAYTDLAVAAGGGVKLGTVYTASIHALGV